MKNKGRQQEFGFTNLGGKRRGAGRKPKGERAGVSHAKPPKLVARYPVLVTMRLRAGLQSLRYDAEHVVVRRAFVASSGERFQVVVYSVQSNHLHLLVEARDERALSASAPRTTRCCGVVAQAREPLAQSQRDEHRIPLAQLGPLLMRHARARALRLAPGAPSLAAQVREPELPLSQLVLHDDKDRSTRERFARNRKISRRI